MNSNPAKLKPNATLCLIEAFFCGLGAFAAAISVFVMTLPRAALLFSQGLNAIITVGALFVIAVTATVYLRKSNACIEYDSEKIVFPQRKDNIYYWKDLQKIDFAGNAVLLRFNARGRLRVRAVSSAYSGIGEFESFIAIKMKEAPMDGKISL